MGTRTPNIGIYIPAAGETNYDQSFYSGMVNIDNHDHSGATNKGVPINSSGLAVGSVTYDKLNVNVADTTSGLGFNGALPNQLQIKGILNALYVMGLTAGTGFLTRNGAAVNTRSFVNGKGMNVSPLDGSGNTTFAIADTVVNNTQPSFCAFKDPTLDQTVLNGATDAIAFTLVTGAQQFQQGTGYATPTFTAPATGVYLICTSIQIGSVVATGRQTVRIVVNGADEYIISSLTGESVKTSANDYAVSGSQILKLTVGDTVQVTVQNNAAPSIVVFDSTFAAALLY